MAKAKWLEGTNNELLTLLTETLSAEEPDLKKAGKIVKELQERTPEDGALTVADALENLKAAADLVGAAYQAELDAMEIEADDEEALKIKVEEERTEYEGTIKEIDLDNDEITIDPEDDDEDLTFDVTDETIIKLNGHSADLDELEEDDEVEIAANGNNALKINAEREDD
jgi:predicted RNA-binding protein